MWWVKPLAGLAVFAALAWGVHLYNESVRKPLQQTIDDLRQAREDDKKRAAALLAERTAENEQLKQNYTNNARASDENYQKQIAAIRAARNTANGLRFSDPFGSRCVTGQAGKSDPGTPETAPTGRELSSELDAFLRAEASRADEIAAYAQSCHRFVNER